MGELVHCKKCNRLFSSTAGETLCSRCNEAVDDGFIRVREYIYDNPSSSLIKVCESTDVKPDAVLKWIKEGKIILGGSATIAFCERCNAPTDGARFCKNCVQEIAKGLKAGIHSTDDSNGKADKQSTAGMHIKPDRR